ncbi:MAG: response regulator transcription factor [Desulfosarcinaceae bacterium]|jgi:DNA-binding NarL/FixJ family response regulator
MAYRILLADDHKIVRDGLKALIEKELGMEVVAEAESGRKALRLARKLKPDVVIMDVSMPDLNGIDATRQILAELPGVKVVALSMHSQKQFVEGMLKAGVCGYLLKDGAFEELINAVNTVMRGRFYLSPDITGVVVGDYLKFHRDHPNENAKELTPREREVLQLIAEGQSVRNIAEELHISVKTVETHRSHIMKKLDLHTVADLTKHAIREGMTAL